jgi:hypothetical protein
MRLSHDQQYHNPQSSSPSSSAQGPMERQSALPMCGASHANITIATKLGFKPASSQRQASAVPHAHASACACACASHASSCLTLQNQDLCFLFGFDGWPGWACTASMAHGWYGWHRSELRSRRVAELQSRRISQASHRPRSRPFSPNQSLATRPLFQSRGVRIR